MQPRAATRRVSAHQPNRAINIVQHSAYQYYTFLLHRSGVFVIGRLVLS